MKKINIFVLGLLLSLSIGSAVDAPTMCTAQYAPVCGKAIRQCLVAPCESDFQTFGNACMAQAAGATDIVTGECAGEETQEDTSHSFDWAGDHGLTEARQLGDFDPDRFITRQEGAKFLSVAYPLLVDVSAATYPASCDILFHDRYIFDPNLSSSIQDVCRIGLMRGDQKVFRPNDFISRHEFFVIMDRLQKDRSLVPSPADEYITRSEMIEALYALASAYEPAQEVGPLEGVWRMESTTLSGADISKIRSREVTFKKATFSYQICNLTSGSYQVEGGLIKTKGVISTMMYCLDSSDIEGAFDLDGATFARTAVKRIEGSVGPTEYLTIMTKVGLEFVLSR